jgi:serine/threonine-protein kinase
MASQQQPGRVAPTVDCVVEPPPSRPQWRAEVSQAAVEFVEGARPQFSDETSHLLRSRLKAVTLVLTLVTAGAFVKNLLIPSVPLIGLRSVIVIVLASSYLALRGRRPLSLRALRGIEAGVFSTVWAQLLLMMYLHLESAATAGDTVAAISAKHSYLAAWAVLLMIYGMLIPSPWRRAAALLLPVACLPYLLLFWLEWQMPAAVGILRADHGIGLPAPLVAACIAVYGVQVIQSARREAFKARQLNQYVLKRRLGSGGMGEVYEAEHQLLKRPCAIKLIKPDHHRDPKVTARFEREVQATARLTHWNTVEIFDYGHTEDGTFYYVMELLPGLSFEDLVLRHGPVAPPRAVHFLLQACNALGEAHGKGLIHRDIKPANLFASERGGVYDVVKLLDFGLVRQQESATDLRLTQPGTFSGSPLYMCPEQAHAYDQLDARSDIYSLGAVAYWLVTGRPPFTAESVWEIITAHARDPLKPPRDVNPDIPDDLERIIIRCLAKMPTNRFQDVQSLAEGLRACVCAGQWTPHDATQWWQAHPVVSE